MTEATGFFLVNLRIDKFEIKYYKIKIEKGRDVKYVELRK